MWIKWTVKLQSIAQTSTNTQEYRMIEAYQFFNEAVSNSSIVPMAYEMLKHQCNLQHCPISLQAVFIKTACKFVHNSAQGTSNAETMAHEAAQEHIT